MKGEPNPNPTSNQTNGTSHYMVSFNNSGDEDSRTGQQVVLTYESHPVFFCAGCAAVIDELISKAFSGRDGRGYLMHSATNIRLGRREDRALLTGVHTVADVFCLGCNDRIGWFYHKAADYSQKYKEGKYLLEKERLIKENAWNLDE